MPLDRTGSSVSYFVTVFTCVLLLVVRDVSADLGSVYRVLWCLLCVDERARRLLDRTGSSYAVFCLNVHSADLTVVHVPGGCFSVTLCIGARAAATI